MCNGNLASTVALKKFIYVILRTITTIKIVLWESVAAFVCADVFELDAL